MPALHPEVVESASPSAKPLTVTRYQFAPTPPAGAEVMRHFVRPHPAYAIKDLATPPPTPASWPEPIDFLEVIRVNRVTAASDADVVQWLVPPTHPAAPLPIEIELEGCTLLWRPGRAVLTGQDKATREALAGLLEFAFLEGELRRLDAHLSPIESAAPADVRFAYQVRQEHSDAWPRLGTVMETLAGLRLRYARLEPLFDRPADSLSKTARRAFARLCARTGVADRLEGVTNRMEACEDLYEGAVDRAADYRWYRRGNRLEVTIVILLLIEAVLMAGELLRGHLGD